MAKKKVKAKLDSKVRQDPVGVIIVILVFAVLMFGVLLLMHFQERQAIRQLQADLGQEIQLREVR